MLANQQAYLTHAQIITALREILACADPQKRRALILRLKASNAPDVIRANMATSATAPSSPANGWGGGSGLRVSGWATQPLASKKLNMRPDCHQTVLRPKWRCQFRLPMNY